MPTPTITTINPATELPLHSYPLMSQQQVLTIVEEVHKAQQNWSSLTPSQRSPYFLKLAAILRKNTNHYATLMTNEMGKPITESLAEVEKCAVLAETIAQQGPIWLQPESLHADGKEHLITFEPLGTIFIIMPWNYPFWQPAKVALPPLMAGNSIILKHASNVTGSSLAFEDAFIQAGFPKNVFRSIICDHQISNALIAHDNIAACSLTGSVSAGSKVASESGKHIKKMVLELGGSDPFIVLADADIEKAVHAALKARTSNAGQVCIGSKRFIVHKSVADNFSKHFAQLIKQLKIGDPLNPQTQMGPLVNAQAVKDMEEFVTDAVHKGAKVLAGGKRLDRKGFFFEPTVLTNTTPQMNAVCTETFGPIAPIIVVENDDEAIQIANQTEFGLSASLWTQDLKKAKHLAHKINAGAIFINSISKSHPLLPIGGIKKSGYGRELSHYGIKEFVNIKTINVYEP